MSDTPTSRKMVTLGREQAAKVEAARAEQDAFAENMKSLYLEWREAKYREQHKRAAIRRRAPLDWKYRHKNLPPREGSRPSPYRGVTWNIRDSLWVARMKVRNHSVCLGVFLPDRAEDAARMYDRAARTHFGQRAILNFPGDPWETLNPFLLYGYRGEPIRAVLLAEARKMAEEGKTPKPYQLCKRLKVPLIEIRIEIRELYKRKEWKWDRR